MLFLWIALGLNYVDRQMAYSIFPALKTDLHFFLGTTQQFHFVAPNPWVIIGVLPIPHERQLGLF